MLRSAARADIAVGYFFINGFEQIADDLSQLQRARILVGRTDRQVFEEVAAGLQQQRALKAQMEAESIIQRRDRPRVARQPVDHIAQGVSQLPQRDADLVPRRRRRRGHDRRNMAAACACARLRIEQAVAAPSADAFREAGGDGYVALG